MVTATGVVMTTADGTVMLTGSNRGRFGAKISSWGLLARAWARKVPQRRGSGEGSDNGREVGTQTVVFRIRYRSDLTLLDRIVYDGHAYDITGIDEIERRKLQDLTCTLIANTRPVS